MAREGISGTLLSVDTSTRELTLEIQVFAFEAEPASDFKSYTYDLGDDWDDERIRGAVGAKVVGTVVDGVVRQMHVR